MKRITRKLILVLGLSAALPWTGCATTGAGGSGLWPFGKSGSSAAMSDANGPTMGTQLGSTTQGIRGQFSSMGTAVTSAYTKTKNAVSSAFTTNPAVTPTDDPTSLNSKTQSVGPEVFVASGQLFETTGKFPQAMDHYSRALAIEPNNPAALASMARLYDRQADRPKAIEFYQRAIQASPDDPQLYNDLGMCYSRQGQASAAQEQIQKAIAIRPTDTNFHSNLASVMVDNGQADQALAQLQKTQTPAMANYRMAVILAQRNNIPGAQQHLTTALQIDPNLQPAREMLNKMGGPQLAQQAASTYQQVGSIYSNVRGLVGTQPVSTGTPGFVPPTNPAINGAYPNSAVPGGASASLGGVPVTQASTSIPAAGLPISVPPGTVPPTGFAPNYPANTSSLPPVVQGSPTIQR